MYSQQDSTRALSRKNLLIKLPRSEEPSILASAGGLRMCLYLDSLI